MRYPVAGSALIGNLQIGFVGTKPANERQFGRYGVGNSGRYGDVVHHGRCMFFARVSVLVLGCRLLSDREEFLPIFAKYS